MTPIRLLGVVLAVAGIAALFVNDISFTRSTEEASLGPVSVAVDKEETVAIPTWAGLAALLLGAGLVAGGGRKTEA
jgi:hypothetical protein